MPLYHFYRLVNNVDDFCYIGMTRSELRKRLYGHRKSANTCSSKQLMDKYGRDNVSIVLIHSLELATNEEAHREERRLIEEYRGRCVNLYIPYRAEEETKEQKKELNKVWRKAHPEEVKANNKAYLEAHKEEVMAYKKAYYEAHKEETKAYYEANKEDQRAYSKAYHQANKEAVNARRREARAKAKANKSPPTVENRPYES